MTDTIVNPNDFIDCKMFATWSDAVESNPDVGSSRKSVSGIAASSMANR